jgi:hypothetical protein
LKGATWSDQKLALFLCDEGLLHQEELLYQSLELPLCKEFCEDFSALQINGNIIKNNNSLMYSSFQGNVLDICVLGAMMKHWILKDFDATFTITIHNRGLEHLINQLCNQLAKPNGFTICQ